MENNKLFLNTAFLYILIKFFGTFFALYIFNYFTPLVDSKLYIEGYYAENLISDYSNFFRTLFIQNITTFLVSMTNPFITHLVFSLFSGIGILILSYSMKNKLILVLLLFPSALVWTSIVGKEAIYYGCLTIILAIWSIQISDNSKRKSIVLHIGSALMLIVCLILRPHYTIPLIYILSTSFVLYTFTAKKIKVILIFIIFSSTIALIIYMLFFMPQDLIARGLGAIDPQARASRFEYFNLNHLDPDFLRGKSYWIILDVYKTLILKEGIFGIIGPFPSELLVRFEFIPFFIEGILILILPMFFGYMLQKTQNYHLYKKYFYIALIPAILMSIVIHAPFGILNPGTAIRWRVNFELIFYAAPLILYLLSKNKKFNE